MPTLGALIEKDLIVPGTRWQLLAGVNGYEGPVSNVLATQAVSGRRFEVLALSIGNSLGKKKCDRLKVCLLEDGYICWVNTMDIIGAVVYISEWEPKLLNSDQIKRSLPAVISWVESASKHPNKYLWGGTIGPDFDCSGMIQTAFSSQGIWLPRDAYQQERFCKDLETSLSNFQMLLPGDLLFFGSLTKCTHVALYIGGGMYCHSSGVLNGRNGIGFDRLKPFDGNPVANYYRSQFRGAGRVLHSYEGTSLL